MPKLYRTLCSAAVLAASALLPSASPAETQAPGARTSRPAATSAAASQVGKSVAKPTSGRLSIAGVHYYYEQHGQGDPLLLLHGGLGSIDMFGPVLAELARSRRVIAVDLQGHGRTPLGQRPFRLESIGNDMAQLAQQLGYGQVDVLGYSLGGGVALRMALQRPEAVRRLVVVSAGFSDDAYYPGIKAQQLQVSGKMAEHMKDTPMYQSYAAVAPHVADFPRLLDTLGALMREKYDWSAELAQLKLPVMLVYGDGDMFRLEHVVRFYQLLGGGLQDAGWGRETLSQNRLAIIPDATHYDLFAAPRLVATVLPFLDGQSGARSWAEQVSAAKK
jgi:pimeloyl-ACP methyl ester carboxylesterase